ncbi:MAG: hypothetical protein K8J08_18540 [Thermoanaerobaculia bacterium]|nr:hypothetical protein [Thermoanaerobaculia bacterium]
MNNRTNHKNKNNNTPRGPLAAALLIVLTLLTAASAIADQPTRIRPSDVEITPEMLQSAERRVAKAFRQAVLTSM